MNVNNYNFGIIGCGNLGFPLTLKLSQINALDFVFCRNEKNQEKLILNNIEHTKIIPSNQLLIRYFQKSNLPNVIIIAVSDDALDEIIELLSNNLPKLTKTTYIFHTSGFLSFEPLLKLNFDKLKVFTAHPYQTFYEARPDIFTNLIWGIENGTAEKSEIDEIISTLSGIPYYLNFTKEEQKQIYHLVAVASSNFLKASLEFAKILAKEIKLNNPEIIKQIVNRSVDDVFAHFNDDEFTLTGPIARKDITTIQKHFSALAGNEELQKIYAEFSLATIDILKLKNIINLEEEKKFKKLIMQHIEKDEKCSKL